VRGRRQLEVDVERRRHAALRVDLRLHARAVPLALLLQDLDALAHRRAALGEETRFRRPRGPAHEGALQRQAMAGEDLGDLALLGHRRVVAVGGDALQAAALDRVGDDQRRPARVDLAALEGVDDRSVVVAAGVVEQADEIGVAQRVEQRLERLVLGEQRLAHQLAIALPQQRLEVVVGEALLEDLAQRLAALLGEHLLAVAAVAQLDDLPAVGDRGAFDAVGVGALQAAVVRDARAVEVLAVVVDDPGDVAQFALGDLGHHLQQRAFAELAVAHHAPEVRLGDVPAVLARVAVGERQVRGVDRRDAHRARRQEAPAVRVDLGVVALEHRLAVVREAAQARHHRLGLGLVEPSAVGVPEQAERVVECVVGGGGVRLAADEVAGLAHDKMQRRQEVEARRARRRVAADLGVGLVRVRPVVGHVDHRHRVGEGAAGDAIDQGEVGLAAGLHGVFCSGRGGRCGGAGQGRTVQPVVPAVQDGAARTGGEESRRRPGGRANGTRGRPGPAPAVMAWILALI